MIKADQLILSVYCKAELDHLPEEQLRKHAELLLDRLEQLLRFKSEKNPRDPWVLDFISKWNLMLDLEEGKN